MPEQVIKYLCFIDQCWQKYNNFYNAETKFSLEINIPLLISTIIIGHGAILL